MKRVLTVLLFLVAASATAQVTVGTVGTVHTKAASTSDSWSFTMPTGSNLYLVLACTVGNSASVVTMNNYPTWNGSNMTLIGKTANASSPYDASYLWGIVNPTTGAQTLAYGSNVSTDFTCMAISFAGVNQSTPTTNYTGTTGNSTGDVSITITGTNSNDLFIDEVASDDNTLTCTGCPSPQTSRGNNNTLELLGVSTAPGSSSNQSMGWSQNTSAIWAHGGAVIQAAGGATSTPTATNTRNRIHIGDLIRTPLPVEVVSTRWKE